MIAQKNVTHLFVGANAAMVTTAAPATARYLGMRKVGEVLCSVEDIVAGDEFQILYYNAAGKLIVSPLFRYNDVVSASKVAPTAQVSEVVTIGYNGTTGDIVETNNGKYLVTVGFKDTKKMIGNKRIYKYGEYTAPSTAEKYDIAIGLADNLELNMARDAFKRVVTKAVCSSPVTAANGTKAGQEVTVVKGSKYLTFETDVTYTAGGAATLAVGDYLRIGTVGAGTALTDPVYRVISINSLVVELDRAVTNASGTYDDIGGTSDIEVIPLATAEAAGVSWGLILTGNDTDAPYEVGKFENNLITFSVGLSADFGTTEIDVATDPVFGKGTYKDMADTDWLLQNNHREAYRIAEYPVQFTSNCVSTDVYNYIYTIQFREKSTDTIGGHAESHVTLCIASVTGGTLSGNLDTCFGSILTNFA